MGEGHSVVSVRVISYSAVNNIKSNDIINTLEIYHFQLLEC
jgi:hypothetical protein